MPSKSKKGETSTKESSTTKSTTASSSLWWWYIIAILPIPILFLSSHFLRHTISSPDANHGSGSMFDLIATRYDFINRALALNLDMSWRHRLVEEIVGENGEIFQQSNDDVRLLDLATGTADVAILLGQAAARYNYPPTSESSSITDDNDTSSTTTVLGLDPSQNMLNVGKTKVQSKELTNIVRLDLGDARKLDELQDDTFNGATMSFGIRNVPEKVDALCEIHRVLKKTNTRSSSSSNIESKLAIMEFSEPGQDKGIMGDLARLFIRHLVPAMGALLSGHPKEYIHLQKSIKDFPSPSEFVKLMEGIKCPIIKLEDEGRQGFGTFRVTKVVNLNFGSVQIYVATPIMKEYVTE